jgi:hypothetical protein
MQRRNVLISRAIILTFVGVLLSGIILVDAAKAGPSPPLDVSLGLPTTPVTLGHTFDISITVKNKTSTAVIVNKVAVGYGLQMLRFRGPYEININPVTVPAFQTINIPPVPFNIYDGSGSVVGLVVIVANGAYTQDGVLGSAFGGVKIN